MQETLTNEPKNVGSIHENVYEKTPSLRWGVRLCLYQLPFLVGTVTVLLIVVYFAAGISGVLGLYPVYIGIGTTLLGILVSIAEAVLVAVCIRASIRIKQTESYLSANENRDKDILDTFYCNSLAEAKQKINEITHQPANDLHIQLQQVKGMKAVFLLLGIVLFNFTFTLIFWGLTIIRLEFNPPLWHAYLIVDMLMGVAAPFCFITSIYIIGAVGHHITNGRARLESLVPAFLTFVKYERKSKDSNYPYWNIVDYFHFPVFPKKKQQDNKQCSFSLHFNLATWCLSIIVAVTFCFSVTYITGQLLTGEQYINACSELSGDGFNCFEHSTREYVNCSSDDDNEIELDCFRFNRIGVHSDPIGTIITALFLYLACEKFLSVMFKFVKEFFKVHPSKLWGVGVTGFGSVLILCGIACSLVYRLVHSVYFDFQKLLQLFIISIDIILSGVLLFSVKHVKKKYD